MEGREIRVVFWGSGRVGKTSSLISYMEGKFSTVKICSHSFRNNRRNYRRDGKEVKFSLIDTGSEVSPTKRRIFAYPNTDVFMIC